MRKTFAGSSDKKKSVAPKIHLNNSKSFSLINHCEFLFLFWYK